MSRRPWLVDLFSIQKIIDEMLHSILHPKSKVMTMRRERFNKDPKLREILKAFSSGPLVEMGTDEDLTPAILLQHPIFASFLEADSVQRARAKTGGSEGSASTSTGSVTNPGSVNDDDDLVDDIEWPSDSSDTWTESLPRSNTDDAYVCLKRDFSAMSPLLQKVGSFVDEAGDCSCSAVCVLALRSLGFCAGVCWLLHSITSHKLISNNFIPFHIV